MSAPNRLASLVFAMLPCVLAAALVWIVVPQFQNVFKNFGSDVPMPTAVFLATYRWWALFALLPTAVWSGWPPTRNRDAAALLCGWLLAGLMLALAVIACYLPIFRLANSTG